MLNFICLLAGGSCGVFFMMRLGYYNKLSLWLSNQLKYSDEKILFLVLQFRNRYCQPFHSVGFNGGMKAFLEGIKPEPYWNETEFNPFKTR